jgi:hypothetical protein
MKRAQGKKGTERRTERRKRVRGKSSAATGATNEHKKKALAGCRNCSKNLDGDSKALFVEEEVGRTFCSESCIADFFSPEIQRLEKEYFRRLSSSDLTGEEREKLAHLRWITLQEPDEVWREKTLSGDHRYTLISEFQPDKKRIWCVCICLFLRGEPSFLYIAFPTRNAAMANHYRRGERIGFERVEKAPSKRKKEPVPVETTPTDGIGTEWTEDETLRAQLAQDRNADDIPADEFGLYQSCFNETLQEPDEVWTVQAPSADSLKLYHFIRHYPDEKPGVWFVVVAREVEDEEQIEILDAFPTRDPSLVERYRQGEQEVGSLDSRPNSRVVH